MPDTFKAGDVVVLKSGGPKMTIEYVGTDRADCRWFVGEEVKQGTFHLEALKIAPDPRSGGSLHRS
jgi:uncharacterized protein YodC (DUF2158 family)